MPVLTPELLRPEPFAATIGIMLYPGTDEEDRRKAKTCAACWLREPYRSFREANRSLPLEVVERLYLDGGEPPEDLGARYWGGTAVGELLKVLYILAKDRPELASWESAIKIFELASGKQKGSRTDLWWAITRFRTVAHLWGAWSIRAGQFNLRPKVGYDGWTDFQFFLTEAESLRDFGQNWRHKRANSAPPLPADVWRLPHNWRPPERQPNWPRHTGEIPDLALPEDLRAHLKPPGRPRKLN